jgi:putative transport protein
MTIDLAEIIHRNPHLLLFILLAIGYLLGRIRIVGLPVGSACGVLIAGVFFGHFGFKLFPGTGDVGFLFFLYAVAFQAGPAFFNVVLAEGSKYVILSIVAIAVAFLLTFGFAWIFNFHPGISAGLLGGSLTSPPGLTAVLDALNRDVVPPPAGFTKDAVLENVNVSYAISYLAATFLVVFLVRLMPNFLRFDLQAEIVKAAKEKHLEEPSDREAFAQTLSKPTLRGYVIENPEVVGKTIADLEHAMHCSVQFYKRNGVLTPVEPELTLALGDRLSIMALLDQQEQIHDFLGSEIVDSELLAVKLNTYDIIVTNPAVDTKTLKELDITNRDDYSVTKVTRNGIELAVSPGLQVAKGDILTVSGVQSHLDRLVKQLGTVEKNVNETDILTFAAGVIAGFLIGQISFSIGGIPIGLGTSGGLLLVGILLGYLRSINPTFGRVPKATLWVFRELGLLLFLAQVGVNAGQGIVKAMQEAGPIVLLCSIAVSTLPVIVAYFVGTNFLKMNRALLLGALTGTVTCTPAMIAVSNDSRSSIPAIGYAGTYAFGLIFTTIACGLILRLI